jgi:hypothetical protein
MYLRRASGLRRLTKPKATEMMAANRSKAWKWVSWAENILDGGSSRRTKPRIERIGGVTAIEGKKDPHAKTACGAPITHKDERDLHANAAYGTLGVSELEMNRTACGTPAVNEPEMNNTIAPKEMWVTGQAFRRRAAS